MFVVFILLNIKFIIYDYKDKGVVFLGGNKLLFNICKKDILICNDNFIIILI